ncbi:MAG: RAD55 family ATPase [Candidatus Dormibacteria bacterium]
MPTGIPDLDLVLGGGLERGSMVVLSGAPGTGKTILAQQICFHNGTEDHKAVYYTTLSEPHTKLVRHVEGFEFFDSQAFGSRVEFVHLGELVRDPDGGGLGAVIGEVVRTVFDKDPSVVVIDSAKALRDFVSEEQLRAVFYDLASRVAHSDAVLLLLGEYLPEEMEGSAEMSVADGILNLVYQPREPLDRRWLRVQKLRGGDHLMGRHTFAIRPTGIEVYPRMETIAAEGEEEDAPRIKSGIPGLNALMGGGMAVGDATVVLGPSGAGKTNLALNFLHQGVREEGRSLYVSFQETSQQLTRKGKEFGWDLGPDLEAGRLVIQHVPVGALDLDILAASVRRELTKGGIRRVVIDSLAEMVFAARESERFPAYARSLVGLIRAHDASVVVTSETSTLGPLTEPVGGMSFLFHNVILLRYLERDSQTRRAINIVKMRNSNHDKGVFEFVVGETGFELGERLEDVTGVLGWSALRAQP